jgi:hypothetical protein
LCQQQLSIVRTILKSVGETLLADRTYFHSLLTSPLNLNRPLPKKQVIDKYRLPEPHTERTGMIDLAIKGRSGNQRPFWQSKATLAIKGRSGNRMQF